MATLTPIGEQELRELASPPAHAPGSKGEHELQARFGTTARAYAFYNNQMLDHINPLMCEFIARQEMLFIATADAHGQCDCSFRAGLPGFVRVVDPKRLMYPEYRGNGVMASLGNIAESTYIGLLFVDFFESTIGLHINGRARILENNMLEQIVNLPEAVHQDLAATDGCRPERWIVVDVNEAYIHCSKHIPLLQKLDKAPHWGSDDVVHKGGDYFHAKHSPHPWETCRGPQTRLQGDAKDSDLCD